MLHMIQELGEEESLPTEFQCLLHLSQHHCKVQKNTAVLKFHHCLYSGSTVETKILLLPKGAVWTRNASRQEVFQLSGYCMDWRTPL